MKGDILNIKVVIDGKPLEFEITNDSERETTEEIIREAAKRLNRSLHDYKMSYKLGDSDEYWRMAALDYAVRAVEYEYIDRGSKVSKGLLDVEELIENYLNEGVVGDGFKKEI